jgi:hypothetical protein
MAFLAADAVYAVGDEDDPETRGWPWIRLGYAYDWENPRNLVGLSEFVRASIPTATAEKPSSFLSGRSKRRPRTEQVLRREELTAAVIESRPGGL